MIKPNKYLAMISFFILSGCAGTNSNISRNIQTATAIDSAFIPGAAIIGAPLAAYDVARYVHNYFATLDMPKKVKLSAKSQDIWSKTDIGAVLDKDRQFLKRNDFAIWRENGQSKKVFVKDIPKNWLNQRAALERAISDITQGYLADDDANLLKQNLEVWKNKGLLVIKYHGYYYSNPQELKAAEALRKGPEGATVIAVCSNGETFELMLPEEWEVIKNQYATTSSTSTLPAEVKSKDVKHP